MEEAKLIRMAAAIREYTVSSMLRETVHSAAESINQAVLSVQTLPWIPEHLLSELAKARQDLARLEQSAVNYQKELAADVEEAQKALIQDRHFHEKDELVSNFNSEAKTALCALADSRYYSCTRKKGHKTGVRQLP